MKEFFLFLRDKSIISAIGIILLMELSLQMGCYRSFLKKNSYAMNVNRITDTAIRSLPVLHPNVMILGTSIAYEGLSPKQLNEKLSDTKIRFQSIAIPGSELIVQELALRKVLNEPNSIKYVVHVNELHLPWIDRRELIDATLSMIGEFDRWGTIQKIHLDAYEVKTIDYIFLMSKLFAYRRDIGDFLLAPDRRIKDFTRSMKNSDSSEFSYENSYTPSIALYGFNNLDECLEFTSFNARVVEGSDVYHRDAIFKTCKLARDTKINLERNRLTELYKIRLKNLYDFIKSKNVKIINIVPPVSNYLDREEYEKLKIFWNDEYGEILNKERWDLSESIPREENSEYYYDLIHFNKKGMEMFTGHVVRKFLERKHELDFDK